MEMAALVLLVILNVGIAFVRRASAGVKSLVLFESALALGLYAGNLIWFEYVLVLMVITTLVTAFGRVRHRTN